MDDVTPVPPRRYRLQGWLVLAVLTAAILATFALLARRDLGARHDIVARQGHDTTWFISRNVSERFRHFDRELVDIVATVSRGGPASDAVREQMARAVRTIPHVLSVGVIDADGVIIQHTDRGSGSVGVSVAERPYLKDARAALGGRGAVLSEPLKSRVTGEPIIGLIRPLPAADGGFAGAVLLAISAEAFDLLAGLPNLPKGSAIAIHRRDGINLFHAPLLPERLGMDLSKTYLFTDALPTTPVGVTYAPTDDGGARNGNDRLLAYRTLEDWPLVVAVGIPRNEIVAGWARDWTRNGLLVGIALIGFSWLAMILQRQITSRLEAELALSRREIEHRQKVEEELRRWATTDALTGLANRRHFIDVAEREMQRAQRYGRPMSVLVFDVDHFKLVNDHHGHSTGDQALKTIAAVGLASLRESDLLGRLGGEEFGVLLTETDLIGGAELAERLRAAIAAAAFTANGEPLSLSVSIGCGDVSPVDENIDCILARADQALYRAKNGGRNRVEIAPSPCRPNRIPA